MKNIWQSEKGKAGITLALWGIFFIAIILLVSCGNRKETIIDETSDPIITVEKEINTLFNSDLTFKMTVESSDLSLKRIYDVKYVINDNSYEGYVQDETGTNKFRCDTKCYKVFLNHEEEEDLYFEELVNNFNYLKDNKFSLKKENDITFIYKEDSINLKVIMKDDISKLIIEKEDNKITFDINKNNA